MERTAAGITYLLTFKKVRNLNLRVRGDGSVHVSAPRSAALWEIDRFVAARAAWIAQAAARVISRAEREVEAPEHSAQEALPIFLAASEAIWPLFADILPEKPRIKARRMKSRWGSCNVRERCITLNTRLLDYPPAALDYVVLHEYVHFLHPNHQKGFHDAMRRLMPDYLQRRALLKE